MKKTACTLLTLALPATLVAPAGADELPFELGGHVRLNYGHVDWGEEELRDGLEFESFRLNISGEYEKFSYKAEYRWYENIDFTTVRYADITYTHDEYWKLTAGVTKVPFGLLPFTSNSFWFSANYYIGFEDDYDAGAVLHYERGDWDVQAGYFMNDEYNDASRFGRYTFDVADDGEFRNQEDGQYNLRVNYTGKFIRRAITEVGASYQHGKILNLDTLDEGDMHAYAVHLRHTQDPIKIDLQYTEFDYDLAAPEGQATDRMAMSSFTFPFLATTKGNSVIANLVYTLPFKFKALSPIKCYTEYSRVNPDDDAALASSQWVNGCSFGWSKLYVYVDSIRGENMWFSGGPGVGLDLGGRQDTTHRFNVSLGVYF
ncbi:OprO/OprP family phosphate-selective porin [Alteromonas sp. ASW11-19]|uniref:OprO/OprP family phosphate-selective porin n=1 Tax=Alteromonas salexigens TaxID=2982530 RepID=A0ABT2VJN3_9ALTE|nr:OprO/OprP family phosphate-selective porin [Alteromonas salexigens]MCU7553209.1 OprO/OprP family phosphate-selective porin [Alteromonas salexigens]